MTAEYEYVHYTPLTMRRRDYILRMLARDLPENWLRISSQEFNDFGGQAFFEGTDVVFMHDSGWFTTSESKGWDGPKRKVLLDVKIVVYGGKGWTPYRYSYTTTSTSSTNYTMTISTNTLMSGGQPPLEGKTEMEHHIDRSKLIEVVTQNKEGYDLVLKRAQALYRDEIEKKTELHVQGQIGVGGIKVEDKDGTISIPTDMSDTFDKKIRALELDSREVIILDDGEYASYVESMDTNIVTLGTVARRLEELP